MTWRLLFTPAASGADNMALDEGLMRRARATGEWAFRVYGWSEPTLSFGRNQSARGGYDLDLLRARGIAVVRRPTGGRAILHHREVTYSVTGPVHDGPSGGGTLRESYARINRLLVAGLRALGVEARIVEASTRSRAGAGDTPGLLPCFHHPSPGEIVHGARKLVGSAQWRCDGALLQHGSILVEDDQMQISTFLRDDAAPSREAIPAPATLHEALGRTPPSEEIASAMFEAVRGIVDPNARELAVDAELQQSVAALREHYLNPDWTWRR